jgi:hypothetical protein
MGRPRRRRGSALAFTDWKDNDGNLNFAQQRQFVWAFAPAI